MKRNLLYIALLLVAAQGAWADQTNYYPRLINPVPTEGPWTFDEVNNKAAGQADKGYSFNELDHSAKNTRSHDGHPTIYQFNDGDGIGFVMCCDMGSGDGAFGVYSTYYHDEPVPAYTRKRLTWKFTLKLKHNCLFYQRVCLYALQDLNALKNLRVDFTDKGDWNDDEPTLLNSIYDREETSDQKTVSFDFDNRDGNNIVNKSWYLLLTQVAYASQNENMHDWGSFKNSSETWTTYYYKHLRFDANGGTGTMANKEIENSAALPANTFTREGYIFAGWATAPDGDVAYADGAEIMATEDSKGPVTLYAVWKAQPASVEALISAIGTVEYTADCNARILAARAAYNALSEEEKAAVTNLAVLTGAEDTYAAVAAVVTAIDALNPVTAEKQTAIAAARTAYNNLSDPQKALVINYNLLTDAEAQYDVIEVIAAIGAIGTVTAESGTAIAAARTEYNALTTPAKKSQVTNYATLLAAEAAYADLSKTVVLFEDKDAAELKSESKAIVYPELPAGASKWQTVEKDASDKTIVIKAVE